jgi:hypothetical protein
MRHPAGTVNWARTAKGKATASRNAYKGGWRAEVRQLSALLREQQSRLKEILG